MSQTTLAPGLFSEAAQQAARAVFSMMAGMDVDPLEAFEDESPRPFDGVVGLVTFNGAWIGSGMICCREPLACEISSRMLDHSRPAVDAEVLDGMGEIANMVLGNWKEIVETHTGPMTLSIPTVLWAKNFCARLGIRAPWTIQPFMIGDERLEVRVCMKKV
ncbi:MAG: hypothetical protein GC160_11785 [Acidobacteria bacterium]|nr:hypothetical protein [Acidobacteriota bacterium]